METLPSACCGSSHGWRRRAAWVSARHHRRDLHVVGSDSESRRELAGVVTLKGGGDHVHGSGGLNTIVHGGQKKGLRSSTRGAGHANLIPVDFRQRLQKIERADRIPQLQAHRVERPQLFRRRVSKVMRQLVRVAVADHVVGKRHISLRRQIRAQRRYRVDRGLMRPAVLPMSMWNGDRGDPMARRRIDRNVKIPGEMKAR